MNQSNLSNADADLDRLRSVLAFVCDIPAGTIHLDTLLCDLPHWSSLTFIVLMTAIENEFNRQPDRDRAWGAADVGALLTILRDSAATPGANG